MKCSACYADNARWATVCVMCGQPVQAIEVCPNGHILPPGSRDCLVCRSDWPAAPEFSGAAILRGVLLVEMGELADGPAVAAMPYLEIRDAAAPLTFAQAGPDRMERLADDSGGDVRILMRPDGLQICRKGGKMVYESVSESVPVAIGGVRMKVIRFEVPGWLK
jgi:hypothetical protein